uniref:Sulfhydryl oxidase n=2 Tax=Acrobeloides nanus TaxID=290746 RepID=A0A914CAW3_9BILA
MAAKASLSYMPKGSNPLLYKPGVDPIVHLDQDTFEDTVFDPANTNGYFVEYYADWCGHCRAFAPFYREFANSVSDWSDVVKVGAVNCADSGNTQVCRSNGVIYFPMIKYFPRYASSYNDGIVVDAAHNVANLKDQLASKVVNEFMRTPYSDWPNFQYLSVNSNTRYDDLWAGFNSANFLVIFFEQFESDASKFMLDLHPFRNQIGVRRALATSPLVGMLHITTFPYVAMFRRGDQQAIYMGPYGSSSSVKEILNRAQPGQVVTTPRVITTTKKMDIIDCDGEPHRCEALYFVSETDLLKAMHYALLDEVIRSSNYIQGQNFTNLYNFVSLLSEHFPSLTFANSPSLRRAKRAVASTILKKSERARLVFSHLKQFLEQKPGFVSAQEWQNQFESVERVYAHPFPTNASWQQCQGSSPQFRGYTCGLWTTFHTLTVHAYMDTMKNRNFNPLKPLKAIQGWVNSFFGCEHCRQHFMQMTKTIFPLNDRRVRVRHDMIMYLWRAHNIVNHRLHGDVTEDPQFIKYQFPPLFLCPMCHSGGHFSRRQVRNFLLRYYANIKPHHRIHSRR